MSERAPQQRVGSFVLLERIGSGGLGEVWKARDPRLNRIVALKFIRDADRQSVRDLIREARAASALNHPNIITIFEIGEDAGGLHVATEFVEGETLRARMDTARVPREAALDILIQIVHGLAAAHRNGIVHRDIKPENVMLRIDGYVKLVDFGLARALPWSAAADETGSVATDSGRLSGTFHYMSPEQARGRTVGSESDVFSFGILLYELLTGEHPFRTDNPIDTLHRIINTDPVSIRTRCPELSRELYDIVDRCLKKERQQRFPSAVDLETEIRRAAARPPRKPRPRWIPVVAAAALALLIAVLFWNWRLATIGPAISVNVRSVAVMNFRPSVNDPASGFLAEGLADQLGGALLNAGFQIPQRSRVLALESGADARTIGKQLQVDAILEGTLTSLEGNVRVYVELVDTRTGLPIWSRTLMKRQVELMTNDMAAAADIAAQLRSAVDRGH